MPTVLKMGKQLYVLLPRKTITDNNILPGNIVDIEVKNPRPDYFSPKIRGLNFKKKKETSDTPPTEANNIPVEQVDPETSDYPIAEQLNDLPRV